VRGAWRGLSARYRAGLRFAVDGRPEADGVGETAPRLGRALRAGGFAVGDLAAMHQQALLALVPDLNFGRADRGRLKRAGAYFAQALAALAPRPRPGVKAAPPAADLRLALAAGARRLATEVVKHRACEARILRVRRQYRTLRDASHAKQRALRLLTQRVITAQEEERKSISRELHDEVVQTLVGINVELSALVRASSVGSDDLRQKIARVQRLVAQSVTSVHQFARELRPAMLDDLGLVPALQTYVKHLTENRRIGIRISVRGAVEKLGSVERTVLFRVAHEALLNVVRHAHADRVRISLVRSARATRMRISDDGRAFRVAPLLSAENPKRLGLVGMRERVEMVGGKLWIESKPGVGTTVCAEIPVPAAGTA
jgi:signal transduction histidine kinase